MNNSLPILSDLNQSGNTNKTRSRLGLCVNTNGSTPSTLPLLDRCPRRTPASLQFSPLSTRYFTSHTSYGLSKTTPSHTGSQPRVHLSLVGPFPVVVRAQRLSLVRTHRPFKPTPNGSKRRDAIRTSVRKSSEVLVDVAGSGVLRAARWHAPP